MNNDTAISKITYFILGINIFLVFSMNSIRVSSILPEQSSVIPLIVVYFLMAQILSFIAFLWFVTDSLMRSLNWTPTFLITIARPFHKVFRIPSISELKLQYKSKSKIETEDVGNDKEGIEQNNSSMPKNSKDTVKAEEDLEKKKKKELNQTILTLNRLMFVVIFLAIMILNFSIWLKIAS